MTKRWLIVPFLVIVWLVWPGVVSADSSYVVQPGDTLSEIAQQHGITTAALAAANSITNRDHVWVGQRLVIPGAGTTAPADAPAATPATVVVQTGDTLAKIAALYGTTWTALAAANGLTNANHIYVGQVLRLSGSAPAPTVVTLPPGVGAGDRWIDVNLSTQRLVAYEGTTPVLSTLISSGLAATPTVTGTFRVWHRVNAQTMSGPGYSLPNVQWVMYFYKDYALHGTYWHSNFGTPMSRGCVNLTNADAQWLYNWSNYNTVVNVHY